MNILIIGCGGHSKVIAEMVNKNENTQLLGFLDDKFDSIQNKDGLVYGPISLAKQLLNKVTDLRLIIGIGDNFTRHELVKKLMFPSHAYYTIIHRSAIVSESASFEEGTVVLPNTIVNTEAKIGKHCILNSGSIVEHHSQVSDFVHISPGAILTGNVTIKEGSFIGSGANIIPNKTIGEWSVIGAGATVTRDISPFSKAVGTPARIINNIKGREFLSVKNSS